MIPDPSTTAGAAILLGGKLLFFAVVERDDDGGGFALAVADGDQPRHTRKGWTAEVTRQLFHRCTRCGHEWTAVAQHVDRGQPVDEILDLREALRQKNLTVAEIVG